MSTPPLQNGLERLLGAPASPQARDPRLPGHDLAWQRALEHAQQVDLAAWFVPLKPAASHAPSPSGATPEAAAVAWRLRRPVEAHPAVAPEVAGSASRAIHASQAPFAAESASRAEGSSPSRPVPPQASARASAAPDVPPAGPSASPFAAGTPVSMAALAQEAGRSLGLPVVPVAPQVLGSEAPASPSAALTPVQVLVPQVPPEPAFPAMALPPAPLETSGAAPAETEVLDARGPAGPAPERAGEGGGREPVRLHAEWSDLGVRVWLGADADQALPLAQVARHLHQWLAAHGERLVSLVCNGRTVWSEEGREAPEAPELPRSPESPSRPSPASFTLTPRRSHGD